MSTPRAGLRITVVVTSAIYALILLVGGIKVHGIVSHLLAYLPSAAGLGLFLFDIWIWRWPWILKLHSRPCLHGRWRVEIRPDIRSLIPDGGNRGPITAYMIIEQSFWTISVTQFTRESVSHSKATAYVRRAGSQQQTLSFTYENEPGREHLARSPRHVGACELNLSAGRPSGLSGTYYTDRFTAGEITLLLIDRSTHHASFHAVESDPPAG